MIPGYKPQDNISTFVEKGNFFAPSGRDDRDLEDLPILLRALELLLPGILLALLLPNVAGSWTIVPFLGGILVLVGCLRLSRESLWFKLAALCAALQVLSQGLRLLGDTDLIPTLVDSPLYAPAGWAASALAAAVPVLLTPGFWRHHRKNAVLMTALAVIAIALPLLKLAGDGAVMIALRAVLALLGAATLLWIYLRTKKAA